MSTLLSAHAAAARLGVSDRTIRRWIAAGRLKADKAAGEFRIALEDLDTLTGQAAAAAAAPGHELDSAAAPNTGDSRLGAAPAGALSENLSSLVALIERQQAQLLERTEAAAVWQARALMLEDRVRALEAPKEQPAPADSPVAAQEKASTPEPVPEALAPWWRRPDAWITPSVAAAVFALVVIVLVLAVFARWGGAG